MNIGDAVTWNTLNGQASGVIERDDENGFLVRLPSGKYIVLSNPERPIKKRKDD